MSSFAKKRRPVVLLCILGVVLALLFLDGVLVAENLESTPKINSQVPDTPSSTEALPAGVCPPDASVKLPRIPRRPKESETPLIPGVSNWAPPTGQKLDPNMYRSLLGFYGPYYNIKELDGQVRVLDNTVYVWPRELWGATGLFRNQTCGAVRIIGLTAHLFGARGEVLAVETATLPVTEVRAGEPAPFVIESSIASSAIAAVKWEVEHTPTQIGSRNLKFQFYEDGQRPNEAGYWLSGSVFNLGDTIAEDVHIVAAWLDSMDRVIYVASPKVGGPGISQLMSATDLKAVDLKAGGVVDFLYTTDDAHIVSQLMSARPVLWGVAK
jgi:hypothetical protein